MMNYFLDIIVIKIVECLICLYQYFIALQFYLEEFNFLSINYCLVNYIFYLTSHFPILVIFDRQIILLMLLIYYVSDVKIHLLKRLI